ncbi:MAG: hypothetical protein JO264_19495 [Acidisphaera sp.]|nr:hypothetical protein [Acidisphaera sp.]
MKASAYLSIFDDWEMVGPALATIVPYVDEIVVVDGAYEWMEPFFAARGRDPRFSLPQVREALGPFGDLVRIINQLWKNEPEKRQAGYAACRNRHIFRVDADEILFFTPGRLEAFLASGCAVAEMEMPIYVAPGWLRSTDSSSLLERQALLFDRDQIGPREHLAYLWLVLPPDEKQALLPKDMGRIFPDPIAFNAHLTHWRTPSTSVSRARFYVLNYFRNAGSIAWIPGFNYEPRTGFATLFDRITPTELEDILLGHEIVAAPPDMANSVLRHSPLSPQQEAGFSSLYCQLLQGLAAAGRDLVARPRVMTGGLRYLIDASGEIPPPPFGPDGSVRFSFDAEIVNATAEFASLRIEPPSSIRIPLDVTVQGRELRLQLPSSMGPSELRRTLSLTVWGPTQWHRFRFQAGPSVSLSDAGLGIAQ